MPNETAIALYQALMTEKEWSSESIRLTEHPEVKQVIKAAFPHAFVYVPGAE